MLAGMHLPFFKMSSFDQHPCYDSLQIVCDKWYNHYDICKLTSTLVLHCFSFNPSVSNSGIVSDAAKLVNNMWLWIIWLLWSAAKM